MLSKNYDFRNDINGLRALAVMPVLFFHAHLFGFEGGFLGVDVFFVISGFLITSIIINDIEQDKFSIWSFWNKRLRRIFPALLFILIISTIVSFFVMLPYDLKNYGQSLVATILSANNILLYLTSGYWSLAAEFKPLYHTWSLAVEDQYYFLIPLLMIMFYKKLNKLVLFFSFLFIVSFILSFTATNKEMNFLIISHRLWELMAGSLVALFLSKYKVNSDAVKGVLGLFLIIFSYVFPYAISENQAIYTLIPVIGTVLIILYSSNNNAIGKLLSVKPLFFIGTISYSIYLFHMPLLAFLRLSIEGQANVYLQVFIVLLSVPLGYISWRYIENTFRYEKNISNKMFYITLVFFSALLLFLGFMLHYTYGFQSYSKFNYGFNPQKYNDEPYEYVKDKFGTNNKKILIIGNSFARDFINMLRANVNLNSFEIILSDAENIKLELIKQADIIIAVSSSGLSNTIDKEKISNSSKELFELLKVESNGEFYYIGTKNFGFNNNFLVQKSFEDIPQYKVSVNNSTLVGNQIEKLIWGEHYIDVLELLIDENNKIHVFTPRGDFISFDTEHVTKKGAEYIGKIILEKTSLKNIFKKEKNEI
ncbi:acyltransferase family protein [Aliarcobacter cryaerophilus]|uniref:acyltransferase family protein n=1 Tax=Aliarcobacter cryaerophilus TaxID=28198 RepID=UPI0021B6C26C|nr:acyltransferase [Aliarcobacter cryaerophilus]MCT7481724.1 acyltransferase [Aliarcobacter cryaerophilus]